MLRSAEPIRPADEGEGKGKGDVFAMPGVRPDEPAAGAVRAAMATGLHHLRANDPGARAGAVDGVHHLRTTTRRLRSALELFCGLTDPVWADRLAGELKWLAQALGAVRDYDVLIARLEDAAKELDAVESLGPLFEGLRERHAAATEGLRAALRDGRYEAMLVDLAASVDALPLADAAWEPCREALPPLVGAAWSRLKRAGRALKPDDPDEDFHEVRKRAKRARYAAEAVRDALEPYQADDADRFARRAKKVQDVLGAHQDAVVAAAEVRRSAAEHPGLGPFNFDAGRLLAREQAEADASRARFVKVWGAIDRKKVVRWLKP